MEQNPVKLCLIVIYVILFAMIQSFNSFHTTIFHFPFNSNLWVDHNLIGAVFQQRYFHLQALLFITFSLHLLKKRQKGECKEGIERTMIMYSVLAGGVFHLFGHILFTFLTTIFYLWLKHSLRVWGRVTLTNAVWTHLLLIIVLPWGMVFLDTELDPLRIILVQLFGLKTIQYLYDLRKGRISLEYRSMYIYFLFPANFLIFPSWIVMPFPSEFKNSGGNDGAGLSNAIKSFNKSLLYLIPLMALGLAIDGASGGTLESFSYHHLTSVNAENMKVIMTRMGKGISIILYFLFASEALIGLYSLLGYELLLPAFNRPWKAKNIFDFWNRFLIHIKNFLAKIYFYPSFAFFLRKTKRGKLALFLTLFLGLAVMNTLCHVAYVYRWAWIKTFLTQNIYDAFKWNVHLLSVFFLFFYVPKAFPRRVLLLLDHKYSRWVKIAGIFIFFCLFY